MASLPLNRRAFTLIEVLLAVALSAVLMALLGGAINLYLLRVGASRGAVEQAQLTRGVLQVIKDDLRNMAVLYKPDTSGVEAVAEAQALFDVDEADQQPPDETESVATERPAVGVSGDADMLQVDVLRIRPAYMVVAEGQTQAITMNYLSPGVTGVRYYLTDQGLVRQQASRDVAIEQEQRGLTDVWDDSTQVIAPEVVDLRFRYHDGSEVLPYWDLEEQEGASPLAVEVRIGFRELTQAENAGQEASQANQQVKYYRVTVALPQPSGESSAEATEEESGETGAIGGMQ